jgi:hypothetical protein
MLLPMQNCPPFGGGLLHSLLRVRVPSGPQVTVQGSDSPQGPQFPLTIFKLKEKNCIYRIYKSTRV